MLASTSLSVVVPCVLSMSSFDRYVFNSVRLTHSLDEEDDFARGSLLFKLDSTLSPALLSSKKKSSSENSLTILLGGSCIMLALLAPGLDLALGGCTLAAILHSYAG